MTINYLDVLNTAKKGNWDQAHKQIQSYSDPMACMIHGYLHRIEGDLGNAQYWYDRAKQYMPDNSLEDEWERLSILAGKQVTPLQS